MTVLDATVRVVRDDWVLDVAIEVGDREVVAVLGPNGAGKTTLAHAIAGLVPIDAGRVAIDGIVVDDPSTGAFVGPAERSVGVVFQDHLLFPRLRVVDNVGFAFRAAGRSRAEARSAATDVLDRLGVAALAGRRPSQLSGGQSQRVALARALAVAPRVLVLDEPLAALDASTRAQVRSELRRTLAEVGGARILVTHDPVDALVLADRLVIVEGGSVTQQGRPAEVVARPATRYVADLVGLNLLHGRVGTDARTVHFDGGGALTIADAGVTGTEVAVAIRPQAVTLHRSRPDSSARNTWAGRVVDIEPRGERVRVTLEGPPTITGEVTAAALADLRPGVGDEFWVTVKAVDLAVYAR